SDLVERLTSRAIAGGAPSVEVFAPATGKKIGDLPQSSIDDIDAAFATARRAQKEWAATPVSKRAAIFSKFHDLILSEQKTMLDILQTESGKSRLHAFDEVLDVANNSRYYCKVAPGLLSKKSRGGAIPLLTQAEEIRRPKGVVTVISPWNYPLALSASDALPALIAGNAVISRPDNQTALTALFAIELAERAGLPAGLWQAVLGRGRVIGDELIKRTDFVDYTGSTATGKTVAQQAASRLIGCSLELGGKNPMVVRADADVKSAAKHAIRACFANAGQLCESMERAYVHEDVYDDFVAAFVSEIKDMVLGADLEFNSDMGSLTFSRQLDTVNEHVNDAVAKGARVLVGGKARPDLGQYFYEPTLLEGVKEGMTVFREETFGPVVSIYKVSSDQEAIDGANDTTYGLNACVFTSDVSEGRKVAEQIKAGAVNINEGFAAAWGSVDAPSGGLGDSGSGRRHGTEGILKYVSTQTIAAQRIHPIAPPPGVSDKLYAQAMTVSLSLMKRIGLK
ncbi:MAG: succinate-semialdehyde dehydrogenase (NADP(+)), partial [Nocardiaceae bacterium]|nr:succinate-semialdehyde dehydrogenase (NADP(+)) [Nocardiaceae bacterium]